MKITAAVLEEIGLPRPYAESHPLRLQEVELADPGPGELLIRVRAAGLCHSDLSVVDGNRVRPTPMVLGHEASGIVEAVGEGVTDIAVGDQVTTVFLPRCEECDQCATDGKLPCGPGSRSNDAGLLPGDARRLHRGEEELFHHLGVSGFATHAVVNRQSVVPVEKDVPPEIAAVVGCAVLTGGGAVINAGRPADGDTVLIVGLGGVGMAALLTAVSLEKGPVIGVDANPQKLARAVELGASAVYSPEELAEEGITAAVVIEAAGHPRAFETAVSATAPGGVTVTVGLASPDARSTIAPLGLTAQARTIVGSYLGSAVPARDIPVYLGLWREGKLPIEELISQRIGFEQINEGLDELAEGRAVRQVVLFED